MDTATAIKNLTTEEHFRTKSKAMALVMLQDCYDIVSSKDFPASFTSKHDFLKTVTKYAGLEPKDEIDARSSRFSIKIVYSSGPGAASVQVVSGVTYDGRVRFSENMPPYLTPSYATDQLALLECDPDGDQG